jgi:hypothetical protein
MVGDVANAGTCLFFICFFLMFVFSGSTLFVLHKSSEHERGKKRKETSRRRRRRKKRKEKTNKHKQYETKEKKAKKK